MNSFEQMNMQELEARCAFYKREAEAGMRLVEKLTEALEQREVEYRQLSSVCDQQSEIIVDMLNAVGKSNGESVSWDNPLNFQFSAN